MFMRSALGNPISPGRRRGGVRRCEILVGVLLLIINISRAQPAGSPFETSVAPKATSRSFDPSKLQAYYAARGVAADIDLLPDSGDAAPVLLYAAKKANAGVLVAEVLYLKPSAAKNFCIVDAAMNDLMRPALYDAFHEILPLREAKARRREVVDVVGPICESTDVLGRNRPLGHVQPGEALALMNAGAYGMSMASRYNSRPLPAEVLVSGRTFRVIRARESLNDVLRGETP